MSETHTVVDLIDNFNAGAGTVTQNEHTRKRVLMVTPFEGWQDAAGVPKIGDAHPDDNSMAVKAIHYKGMQRPESERGYSTAVLEIEYSTTIVQLGYVVSIDMAGELMSLGNVGYFATSGAPLDAAVSMPLATGTIKISLPEQSVEPTSGLVSLLNKVNSAAYTFSGATYSWPIGTLYFAGWRSERARFGFVRLEYEIKFNLNGWNKQLDPTTGLWDTVLLEGSGATMFQAADFASAGVGL